MARAIGVREGEGQALRWTGSKLVQSARHYRTLWIGVLYAITIVVVLAFVAKLQ